MTETQDAEVVEITLEKKIETELVKHNVTEAVLSALETKYSGITLKGLEDRESYLELKQAARDCSKVRNLAVKCCKEGREDAVKVQKLWVAKEKEVIARIAVVENALDSEIQKFDDEVERKKNEERKRQEEAYMQRTQALTKMGAVYANESFTLGEFSMEANLVKETSQEVWEEKMLPSFTAEYQKIEAERIEQERIKTEQQAEVRRQQQELERQQEALKEQQAAFQKQQEKTARIERERIESEQREIRRQQTELQNSRLQQLLRYNQDDMFPNTLWQLSESEFVELLGSEKEKFTVKQAEKQRKIEEISAQRERERIEEEQRIAEIQRQQAEQRKIEELEQASDKVKYADLIKHFSAIKVPEMRSGQYRKKTAIIREKLEEIINL